jgi:fructose-1,6-bisphosphatase/inositol monophosphatase family enzyme
VIYFRLLPWDHAPGALILTEAGGSVTHEDGSSYSPLSISRLTILARTPQIGYTLREWVKAAS